MQDGKGVERERISSGEQPEYAERGMNGSWTDASSSEKDTNKSLLHFVLGPK